MRPGTTEARCRWSSSDGGEKATGVKMSAVSKIFGTRNTDFRGDDDMRREKIVTQTLRDSGKNKFSPELEGREMEYRYELP